MTKTHDPIERHDMTTWKDAPTRTIDVDGVTFAYRELGTGSDIPVVFLHHLTAVLDDWDPRVVDGIAAHHRVIAFDNRGVGATGGSVPTTVEQMGTDAIAFIRAMGLEKVDLFGFSLGGGVAQMVALQAPELVRRMILAGTGPRGGGGIDKMATIVGGAYAKAALTSQRSPELPVLSPHPRRQGSRGGLPRATQGTQPRPRQEDLQPGPHRPDQGHPARRPESTRRPIAHHPARLRRQRRPRPHGRQRPLRRHGTPTSQRPVEDLPQLRTRRRVPAPPNLRPRRTAIPRQLTKLRSPQETIMTTNDVSPKTSSPPTARPPHAP